MINTLDDPFLLNRQFARRGFEELLGVKLLDYGYRFYMMPEERKQPMAKLRQILRAAFAESTLKKPE